MQSLKKEKAVQNLLFSPKLGEYVAVCGCGVPVPLAEANS